MIETRDFKLYKKAYYNSLDEKASSLSKDFFDKDFCIEKELLKVGADLYASANTIKNFANNEFETAYHDPISGDLEFLISRFFYHYSKLNNLGWKVYLRRQVKKATPDVRIEKKSKTIAVIEVKAKAGWIQPFFSRDREDSDVKKLQRGQTDFDPKRNIQQIRKQLDKYRVNYKLKSKMVFLLLPSLVRVYRKKYNRTLEDYEQDFIRNSGLPDSSFVILSENLNLDLSKGNNDSLYKPTDRFRRMIKMISLQK